MFLIEGLFHYYFSPLQDIEFDSPNRDDAVAQEPQETAPLEPMSAHYVASDVQTPVISHTASSILTGPRREYTPTLISPNNEKYIGDQINGMPQGWGIMNYPDGKSYGGEWKLGVPYGQGTLTVPDIGKYTGVWSNGQRHGAFAVQCENGDLIELEYKLGKICGEVKITKGNGDKCVFEYNPKSERQQGKISYEDDSTYEGDCWFSDAPLGETRDYNGLPDGKGIKTGSDETKLTCPWKQGAPHGTTTLEMKVNGVLKSTLTGETVEGKKVGEWQFTYKQSTFTLTFEDDQMKSAKDKEGNVFEDFVDIPSEKKSICSGKLTKPNGNVYIGEFIVNSSTPFNLTPHDKGKMINRRGVEYEGTRDYGELYGDVTVRLPSGTELQAKATRDNKYIAGQNYWEWISDWNEVNERIQLTTQRGTYNLQVQLQNTSFNRKGSILYYGTIQYHNGCKYEGYCKSYGKDDFRPHGKDGTMTYGHGRIYKGQWYEGKKFSFGEMTFSGGIIVKGDWSAGRKLYPIHGGTIIINGKRHASDTFNPAELNFCGEPSQKEELKRQVRELKWPDDSFVSADVLTVQDAYEQIL